MTGTVFHPLSEQIASTIAVHGADWALAYYTSRGVAEWEFRILAGTV